MREFLKEKPKGFVSWGLKRRIIEQRALDLSAAETISSRRSLQHPRSSPIPFPPFYTTFMLMEFNLLFFFFFL